MVSSRYNGRVNAALPPNCGGVPIALFQLQSSGSEEFSIGPVSEPARIAADPGAAAVPVVLLTGGHGCVTMLRFTLFMNDAPKGSKVYGDAQVSPKNVGKHL